MAEIEELRSSFNEKINKGIPNPPGSFEPQDLERVKDDEYLKRILKHCENDVKMSTDMLFKIMIWRKTNSVNAINDTINMEYLKEGIFFPRGRDIDNCTIFIMKSKLFVKGKKNIDDLKRIIIYWMERLEREEKGKKITLFFDMDDCGLNNMDMDIISYIITLMSDYYPDFVNYIIIFELQWLLSAGFKLIKGILPSEAVEKLHVISKDKLKQLVSLDQALVSWGGEDNYTFEFTP